MSVSIAMATFNGARYIEQQLESFVSQDRLPDELIVCDDGSTDETVHLVERFKTSAPFHVELVCNPKNLGFAKNFENALNRCHGEIVLLSDQDDVWLPGKVRRIESFFVNRPRAMLVVHDGKLTDERLVWHGATIRRQMRAFSGSDELLVIGALTGVRAELLRYALPIPDGINSHDTWLHSVARCLGGRHVLDETLGLVRRHRSNTSRGRIADTLQPINPVAAAAMQMAAPPATDYDDRAHYNAALYDRLQLIRQTSVLAEQIRLDRELDVLRAEAKSIARRQALLSKDALPRKLHAMRMLVEGDYRHFSGVKSFVRDFLGRRARSH